MKDFRCKLCTWWDNKHKRVQCPGAGFCRKHKPGAEKRDGRIWGAWPLVDENDFCGEFREDMKEKK